MAWTLRPYQEQAVRRAAEAADDGVDRIVVQVPCGGGKTAIAQRITEERLADRPHGVAVVFVPTLGLLAQTAAAFTEHAAIAFTAVAVCSGDIGEDAAETTTDPGRLAEILTGRLGRLIVFCTYASAGVVAEAVQLSGTDVDGVICDEGHRTAGLADKAWALPLSAEAFPARWWLFLTATPRVVEASPDLAGGDPVLVASMADERLYGPVVHRSPFRQMIDEGWLSDYAVAIVAVTTAEAQQILDRRRAALPDGTVIDLTMAAGQVALARAARDHGLRSVLAFANRIEDSKAFTDQFHTVLDLLPPTAKPDRAARIVHIDGTQPGPERRAALDLLADRSHDAWTVVSNCKVLGEGVDCPRIDAVFYTQPRTSGVDIIQTFGRAIRPHPDDPDRKALVVLPVLLRDSDTAGAEAVIQTGAFADAYRLLVAIADHDELLFDSLAELRSQPAPADPERLREATGGAIILSLPEDFGDQMARAVTWHVVERSTSSWFTLAGHVRDFYSRFGHVHPRSTQEYRGFPIGARVRALRRAYAADKLDPRVIDWFNRLGPWWDWHNTPRGVDRYSEGIDALHRYLATGARTVRTWSRVSDASGFYPVGKFVHDQATAHHAGKLPAAKYAELAALLGPDWYARQDQGFAAGNRRYDQR